MEPALAKRLSPAELARRLTEMVNRRRPDLSSLLEEAARGREGLRAVSEAFGEAYEVYASTNSVEAAYDKLVKALSGVATVKRDKGRGAPG